MRAPRGVSSPSQSPSPPVQHHLARPLPLAPNHHLIPNPTTDVDIGIGDLIIVKGGERMRLLIRDRRRAIRMHLDRRRRARGGVLRGTETSSSRFGSRSRFNRGVEVGRGREKCNFPILGGKRVGVRETGRGGRVGILLIVIREERIERLEIWRKRCRRIGGVDGRRILVQVRLVGRRLVC